MQGSFQGNKINYAGAYGYQLIYILEYGHSIYFWQNNCSWHRNLGKLLSVIWISVSLPWIYYIVFQFFYVIRLVFSTIFLFSDMIVSLPINIA